MLEQLNEVRDFFSSLWLSSIMFDKIYQEFPIEWSIINGVFQKLCKGHIVISSKLDQ